MNIRYRVTLSAEERADLLEMVQNGKGAVRRMKRAQILLAADHTLDRRRDRAQRLRRDIDRLPDQTAVRRRRTRGSARRGFPAGSTSEAGRRGRSDPLRAGLLEAPAGACALDFAVTRR